MTLDGQANRQSKFHAKAYITYFRDEYKNQFIQAMNIPAGYALVGSSNFTKAGLTQNIELNVQVNHDVEQLQEWFEKMWCQGEDITDAVLKVIENHCKEYSPFDVYLRSMYEYFKSREETVSEWENNDSVIYSGLSQYQKDGYNSLVEIADKYSGAFLCDGVGLGKTFVGLMLIERYVKKERKNVVLIVPAAARISVWETTIKKYIPEILDGFYPFKIINHTDLLLEKNQNLMDQIAEQAEIIVIDEAHHFRNRASNRYQKLFDMMGMGNQKKMFMLTATPINNSFMDLQHLIELFTHRKDDYFAGAPLGIHSLSGHFKKMENCLREQVGGSVSENVDASEDIFRSDMLVNELAEFIDDIMNFDSNNDDKIRELKRILDEDEHIKNKKVIIFTEYRSTARYIFNELKKAGYDGLFEIDGQSKGDRHDMVVRFSPYYNDASSASINDEIRVLIATDVLAEGLNLQDAQCLINYELHWNPVRLMQRIGRVDRRRNSEIEAKLLFDHPELAEDRANAYYWNFLPPTELEKLLSLYRIVTQKTLRISKTFGIEGKKLLTPDDDFEALKEFNSQYEGSTSTEEEMALAYQELIQNNPDYINSVKMLPQKMYSGKSVLSPKGYFFCFELPSKRADGTWSRGDGLYRWYFVDQENKTVLQNTYEIWKIIKCSEDEPRVFVANEDEFSDNRKAVERFITRTYLHAIQAPVGIKARLVTWMQVV
ncbi:MAG: DEAD/DEAH box helicase family protein [Eubacteriales bacterium]|nr:DEAD/DEAH box helicase family protein [Eubacteriales bacterium]